ncbi:amidohydrolase family protein [Roseiconus nitratireducens]|uniref:Amidohydrolase family protein n=1 Tax=Roseiconus nitratireducens TaxID=2605748 RepID=A0A5M6DCY8_9BACT|nr:amidohydrolase family protein [Roseiconus nitratireducens]KAA5545431.1 amidohydrolase family protein [Roseiconus nitratireducens]
MRFGRWCLAWLALLGTAAAQPPGETQPVTGLRENSPDQYLLANARVVTEPGHVLPAASVLVRGTAISAVGADLQPPPGAKVIDCDGKTIYAGLIDSFGEVDVPDPPSTPDRHWNGYVQPRRRAAAAIGSVSGSDAYRRQGVTMRLIAPRGAIFNGDSCLVMLDGGNQPSLVYDQIAQHLTLTVPRGERRDDYPNSPMGAIALLRQTLSDARWYREAWQAYHSRPELDRPQMNSDLDHLASVLNGGRFVVDAPNERMAQRGEQLAREFTLDITLRGSGREYRDLASIRDGGRMVLLPVDFPEPPNVVSEAAADDVSLRDLMHWHFAPENPARLAEAGVRFCLTSDGLDSPKDFRKNLCTAVQRGLAADAALAALTTTPAQWLGVEQIAGRVRVGALANLVITDGDLFDADTKVLETWVSGQRFEHDAEDRPASDPLVGRWTTSIKHSGESVPVVLELSQNKSKWSGDLRLSAEDTGTDDQPQGEDAASETQSSPDQDDSDDSKSTAKLKDVVRAIDRLTAWVDLQPLSENLPAGPSRLTLVTVPDEQEVTVFCTVTFPDGEQVNLSWRRVPKTAKSDDAPGSGDNGEPSEEDSGEDSTTTESEKPDAEEPTDTSQATDSQDKSDSTTQQASLESVEVTFPLGGFGRVEPAAQSKAVLFRGATVWTCGDQGKLDQADVLIVDGKIQAVEPSIEPPSGCRIIDASGKHLTPGLIDCHSHMATDGGVNESGQAVTAEVRVGDFVDNSDINIYRQLAGGLTIANVLHGSANPIGGQNQVIKLRWGDSMEAIKMGSAPPGIKFALGENVKRSNSRSRTTRYPASRPGVEQLIRDRFLAAKAYRDRQQRWADGQRTGLPPRVDYELEALAEVLEGRRWIHCHSYRQDEIVALLDLLDEFDVTIGTLQHILEGYKVADRMLEHGAMGSSFSDWWAYKFEVYDAIPQNGAIMHDVGIVVSFNSDDAELARHMNTEAAKAVKYGDVAPQEALKFVTLNPARQLRIDDRVGSLEPGKDGDVVLWSGPPLSTLSRCEQTWIDGRLMFSLEQDREYRRRDSTWRSMLIRRLLDQDEPGKASGKSEMEEEDRWLRYDEFCHDHDHEDDGHAHDGQHQEAQ